MRKKIILLTTTLVIAGTSFIGGYAFAQMGKHEGHQKHRYSGGAIPKEAGQSAFAAMAEIVQILNEDANTDWSKVNFDALREHLVDMNALTLGAEVAVEAMDNKVRFIVSGTDSKTIRAVQNMVPAHAKELDKMSEWQALGTKTDNGAVLTIEPTDITSMPKIEALGFFGLMATGAHHQPHHLGMASGTFDHQH